MFCPYEIMRSVQVLGSVVALASTALSQAPASVQSCDTAAGICFSTYTDATTGISVGISLPQNVTDPYDAIVKVVSPVTNTWVGFSWGGTMTWNPLSVAWPNAKTAVVSSRFALYVTKSFLVVFTDHPARWVSHLHTTVPSTLS